MKDINSERAACTILLILFIAGHFFYTKNHLFNRKYRKCPALPDYKQDPSQGDDYVGHVEKSARLLEEDPPEEDNENRRGGGDHVGVGDGHVLEGVVVDDEAGAAEEGPEQEPDRLAPRPEEVLPPVDGHADGGQAYAHEPVRGDGERVDAGHPLDNDVLKAEHDGGDEGYGQAKKGNSFNVAQAQVYSGPRICHLLSPSAFLTAPVALPTRLAQELTAVGKNELTVLVLPLLFYSFEIYDWLRFTIYY